MLNLPVIAMLIAGVASSLVAVSSINMSALYARPEMDMPRLFLCSALLSQGAEDWTFEDVDRSKVPPKTGLPVARSFAGDQGKIDDETAAFLFEAQTHTIRQVEIDGEFEIRLAMAQARSKYPLKVPGVPSPSYLANLQTFKDYQSSRFALELENFNQILDDYAAGKNTHVTALAVAKFDSTLTFSTFAVDSATSGWSFPSRKQMYFWHMLSYDPDLKTPVWRAGLSEL